MESAGTVNSDRPGPLRAHLSKETGEAILGEIKAGQYFGAAFQDGQNRASHAANRQGEATLTQLFGDVVTEARLVEVPVGIRQANYTV